MKWRIVLLVFVLSILLVPSVALADSPQPVQYSLVKCSGFGIDLVVSGQRAFDDAYGSSHQLTTSQMWEGTYVTRVNEFAHAVGCPDVLKADGSAATLTFWAKLYAPVYQSILTHRAFPY